MFALKKLKIRGVIFTLVPSLFIGCGEPVPVACAPDAEVCSEETQGGFETGTAAGIAAGAAAVLALAAGGTSGGGGSSGSSGSTTSTALTTKWTKQIGTSANEYGDEVTTDKNGNVYVTGSTGGNLGTTNAGNWDVFLVKYNSSGVRQWTRQVGTSSEDRSASVATDSSGNAYVTGWTAGSLSGFNAGEFDGLLIKYSSSGVRLWTRQVGTSSEDGFNHIAIDSSDNIYVAGWTEGGLGGNLSSGESDLLLIKYDSSGSRQWTHQFGTSSGESVYEMAIDFADNIYLTGYTRGNLDGNANAGEVDIFLVKYSSSGVRQWTRQYGTSSNEAASGIGTDSSGNIYIAGRTEGGLSFYSNSGGDDIFLIKYSSSGVRQWIRQLGTSSDDAVRGLTVDAADNVYLAGLTVGSLSGLNAGEDDAFLIKYNSSGSRQWTRQFGTSSDDWANMVTINSSGDLLVTGGTEGNLDGNSNSGGSDIFLVKFDIDGNRQ